MEKGSRSMQGLIVVDANEYLRYGVRTDVVTNPCRASGSATMLVILIIECHVTELH